MLTLTLILTIALTLATAASARHWPRPPAWWLRQARCIAEGIDWRTGHPVYVNGRRFWGESTGSVHDRRNPQSRGYLQITWGTWRSVGGSGDPADATLAEQLYRGYRIWHRDGGSWREWPLTSRECGLA